VTVLEAAELAAMIDQTLLTPITGEAAGLSWIAAQRDAGFACVCVMPALVPAAVRVLSGTSTRVCTVVSFPMGYALTASKADEARRVVDAGADEVDMVLDIGAVLERDFTTVEGDIAAVTAAVEDESAGTALVKVILETGYLTPELIGRASEVAVRAGAHFVKTCTGFGPRGASVEDVRTIRAAVGPCIGVKAAGGIHDLAAALAMIDAGASRIGTSAGLEIVGALAVAAAIGA
jgi:deoxyribose-phosphate aldolase